ncbi:bifunctional 4-alpha-glucanotransferase/amylo-alpha-1,6-glucosidase [Tieghemiomyces parasiticus]|uniref:Glycogen debranching enzyme n=1 Tax=Tieghemiomyces parasiticus TaxID=78921 RepID=A0A9W7ZSI6_9FUNG|nr:bifunctional 4-alpha-glucanotransferase/amylo-alpha-1,6-glucosidase [Tieghemiomyces parasiticus]
MAPPLTVYALQLLENGEAGKVFYRLPAPQPNYGLRFQITAGSEAANAPVLHTNYPLDGSAFSRSKFHSRPFSVGTSSELICELLVSTAGPYSYYVEYQDDSGKGPTSRTPLAYFLVDPHLEIRTKPTSRGLTREAEPVPAQSLPLDGIVMQTMVPKWMGPLHDWHQHLAASAELGYNVLHFVPPQQRGSSNSPYSIYDQLALSDDLFTPQDRVRSEDDKFERLRDLLLTSETELGMLSLADMVWNHTANNSDWLQDHPEAAYNLHNSPHLSAAFELDEAIMQLSGRLAEYDAPTQIHTEAELDTLLAVVKDHAVQSAKLWEFYAVDVVGVLEATRSALEAHLDVPNKHDGKALRALPLAEKAQRLYEVAFADRPAGVRRKATDCDTSEVLSFMKALCGSLRDIEHVLQHAEQLLNEYNVPRYDLYDAHVASALQSIRNTVKYERLDSNGPRRGPITASNPIVPSYFTRLPDNARTAKHPPGSRFLANNGWVWNGNALVNFAEAPSTAYIERAVIVWSDCVKLRYGTRPEDNPWLWAHMREYTETMARLFHGFRIDNCHSTPIELAEYLLDCARAVRPNLYVLAELFTGSEEVDRLFVSRLGINSLVREALQPGDSFELSRQVHRAGGKAIGTLDTDCLATEGHFRGGPDADATPCRTVPLTGSLPHAMFTDCTHDNPTPTQKRTSEDALPTAAIVALTCSASASVKGYDELYPKLLELPSEHRTYQVIPDPVATGLGRAKRSLQLLHTKLAVEGYSEVHVHHENEYVMVHRQHPVSREGYLVIAHCAFPGSSETSPLAPVKLRQTTVDPVLSMRLHVHGDRYQDSPDVLTGLPSDLVDLDPPHLHAGHDDQGTYTELTLPGGFGPGSILLVKTNIPDIDTTLDEEIRSGANAAVADLDLLALNAVLYRCDAEERDICASNGVYNVPNYGALPYCGLQGWMSILKRVIRFNDLGHPICDHLRAGTWALDYIVNRLEPYQADYPALASLADWFRTRFDRIRRVPNFLRPKYFALVVHTAYEASVHRALGLMAPFVVKGDPFVQRLALCAVQLYSGVRSTGLHPTRLGPALAAGLPHFATAHMRCWGRDVFISLPGLLLTTGHYDAARAHILAFASSVRHGLIPNLLDANRKPRYNARDAAWWFLQAVQTYCHKAPEGTALLRAKVARRFPRSDEYVEPDSPEAYAEEATLAEIVHEILTRHANGIHFREWNAGPNLDHAMREEGFQIDIDTDWTTGFVQGGNDFNCGTWMDKMGDSAKAGILGLPATPRNGAPVEITGLLKSTLRWLRELAGTEDFPFRGVEVAGADGKAARTVTFQAWDDLVQKSFEKYYYVPAEDDDKTVVVEPHPKLINRRGIYKDTVGSSKHFGDYQLRPNYCVAMAVAPELFSAAHARTALDQVRTHLLGPLGLKTLDPADWAYRGNYDNSNDSADATVAHGINYHQGPEWVWVIGFFLQSWLRFARPDADGRSPGKAPLPSGLVHQFHQILLEHKTTIASTPFAGLPELTNAHGAFCAGSCPTQAWSAATILTFLEDLAATKA